MNILLIGDSLIDNATYVGEEKSVTACLKNRLPNANIINSAVDGYTTYDLLKSFRKGIPAKYDYVILSIGGNDLLQNEEILINPAPTGEKKKFFGILINSHQRITKLLKKHNSNLLSLNLYYPSFDDEEFGKLYVDCARNSICKFNDTLELEYEPEELIDISEDIRDSDCFVSTIEPSAKASLIIAELIDYAINRKDLARDQKILTH